MNTRRLCALVAAGAAMSAPPASSLVAQSPARGAASGRSSSDTAFPVARNGVIDITMTNNTLVVRGTDRSNAELRAKPRSYKLQASGVSVVLNAGDDTDARARRSRRDPDDDDKIDLAVPRGVRLVVHGASGDVDIADVTGDIDVHVLSGDIKTRNLGGRAIIETLSGDVHMFDGVGDLRVTTVSGDIKAQRVRGTIDVNTTSGTIELTAERTSRVQVDASSSDINFSGGLTSDARVEITTHSGDIVLRLPDNISGLMDVATFDGELRTSGLSLVTSGQTSGQSNRTDRRRESDSKVKHFEFGGGGSARITLSTFSGDVTVQRLRRSNED